MALIQIVAIALAGAVAFFITRAGFTIWRLLAALLAGVPCGFIAAIFLADAIAGKPDASLLASAFLFALVGAAGGAIAGTALGGSAQKSEVGEPAAGSAEPSQKQRMPRREMLIMSAAVVGALLLYAVWPSDARRPAGGYGSNYAECVLISMPGLQNDAAAGAAHQVCLGSHPGGFGAVAQGALHTSGDFTSGADCTLQMAADTRSNRAAAMINAACRKLYDEPEPDWEKGIITPPPR